MSNYEYIPNPPRVWSRVQNQCTYIIPGSTYEQAFIPLTGQTVSQAQADYEMKQIYKGNILQYKGNSARLTKYQRYSQLARCAGPNRTKVFATQSETYSNPNTTGLLRSGYITYPYPNQIVGAPNNISGPFAYGIPNPNDCSGNSIQDGGTLVCGTYANPCSGEIYKTGPKNSTICNPSSASNVPGTTILCWNNKVQTWFPKPRYIMNNSTDKWPFNYKGFVSAVKPNPPVLTVNGNCGSIDLNWTTNNSCIFPISGYNIYINEQLYITLPPNINSFTINNISNGTYEIYMKSISNNFISDPSTKIVFILDTEFILITKTNIITPTLYNNFGFKGLILETSLEPTYNEGGYGELIFKLCVNLNVNILMVGGGGGGSSSVYYVPGDPTSPYAIGPGGGGGGINYITGLIPPLNTNIDIKIGCGGASPIKGSPSSAQNGFSSSISYNAFSFLAQGGFGASTIAPPNLGGGKGGDANVGIGTSYGGGGGGGGLAVYFTGVNTNNGGAGGSADLIANNGNPGTNTSPSSFPPYGNGGSSQTYSFAIPFLGININVGGGGGGGSFNSGGKAGNGVGGLGGNNINVNGQDATNYGGGGGGGGIVFGSGIVTSKGGNGGNGVIYIWW